MSRVTEKLAQGQGGVPGGLLGGQVPASAPLPPPCCCLLKGTVTAWQTRTVLKKPLEWRQGKAVWRQPTLGGRVTLGVELPELYPSPPPCQMSLGYGPAVSLQARAG